MLKSQTITVSDKNNENRYRAGIRRAKPLPCMQLGRLSIGESQATENEE
jgi:hypothetical protein